MTILIWIILFNQSLFLLALLRRIIKLQKTVFLIAGMMGAQTTFNEHMLSITKLQNNDGFDEALRKLIAETKGDKDDL